MRTSISTYLKCKSLSQSAVSPASGMSSAGAQGCHGPWGPASWPGALQLSQGGFGLPRRVASLWVGPTWPTWVGWGFANLGGGFLQVSPHPASLHPFGQGHPLSPSICVAAAVFCFLMVSKAFLSPSFSWRKKGALGAEIVRDKRQ